jgi:hypothetical protein
VKAEHREAEHHDTEPPRGANPSRLKRRLNGGSGAGLLCSVVMLLSRDGHGVGLLVGGSVASMLPLAGVAFRSKQTNVF